LSRLYGKEKAKHKVHNMPAFLHYNAYSESLSNFSKKKTIFNAFFNIFFLMFSLKRVLTESLKTQRGAKVFMRGMAGRQPGG